MLNHFFTPYVDPVDRLVYEDIYWGLEPILPKLPKPSNLLVSLIDRFESIKCQPTAQ